MTDRHVSDAELREAFQSLGHASDDASPADLNLIWRAVTGELPSPERHDLVDRTARDPALADAWRVARALHHETQEAPPAVVRSRRSWNPWWMSAAAGLLIAVTAGLMFQWSSPTVEDTFRGADPYAVNSLVPSRASLPRDAFRLRWTPGPEGSRYQLRVTTDDLKVITTASDLTTPEFVVPGDRLAILPAGSQVFWQVDTVRPDGQTLSSQTFVVSVQ